MMLQNEGIVLWMTEFYYWRRVKYHIGKKEV